MGRSPTVPAMTEAADPRAGAGDAAREHELNGFAELFRSGFVLVVHESGMTCTEVAHAVTKQCEEQGIRYELLPIDQVVDLQKLAVYTALFLVLPVTSGSSVADVEVLAQFETVYAAYREFRPKGLTSVLAAEQPWWFAGPVQTLLWGRDTGDLNPFPAHEKPCVVRYVTGPAALGNVFDVYQPLPAPPGFDPHEAMLQEGIACWELAQSWNVRTLAEADEIYSLIERRIKHWNDERFPTTRKPLKNTNRNRLQLVFDDPEMVYPTTDLPAHLQTNGEAKRKAMKAFTESGAMVVRNALKVIQARHPQVIRPGGRTNTRDNQKAFTALYKALLYLHGVPPEVRDRIPES